MKIPLRRRISSFLLSFLLTIFIAIPFPVNAGEFELDTEILGQVRENEADQNELPVNSYLGMSIDQPKAHISAETNMRHFRDFEQSLDDYDLYQAVLHAQPLEMLQIDFGRQFVNQGFSAETLDAIQFTIMPPGHVDISLYTGIPRTVEIGDFNKNDGLLTGLRIGLKEIPRTNAQVNFAWRKNNIRFSNLRENDEFHAGLSVSHQFKGPITPLIYGLFEYDASATSIEAGTAGMDLYPARFLALNWEFNYFNINRDTNRQTILGLLTQGEVISGRLATTWTLVPDLLDFVQSYAYQWLEIQSGLHRHGHLLDTAFQFSFEGIGLHNETGYYLSRSFGGDLHGIRTLLHEQFTKKLYAEVCVDFTIYNKITNENDNAISTILWAGYEILDGWIMSGGFEYGRNNAFTSDIRGAFKIEYHFGLEADKKKS